MENGNEFDSGLVMYPSGHARNTTCDLNNILENKFKILGKIAVHNDDTLSKFINKVKNVETMSNNEIKQLYQIELQFEKECIDGKW